MDADVWISSIKFKSGLEVSLEKDSILIFVGPNNSGKSLALREIMQLSTGNPPVKIIEGLTFESQGTVEDFLEKLANRKHGENYFPPMQGGGINVSSLKSAFSYVSEKRMNHIGAIGPFVVKHLETAQRLGLVDPADVVDVLATQVTHPIQILYQDTEKELKISTLFKQAFGEELIVNFGAGAKIPVHVGKRPNASPKKDRVSPEYLGELKEMPYLHQQGDGMKSFAGILLSFFSYAYNINIIDEPEAFLHPPQAFLLGKMVAADLGTDRQLIFSTHSEDFLKGLLDTAPGRIVVIRLQRDEKVQKTSILENKKLQEIWQDTLLRHSNAFAGLFHKKVVLAESDSDCQFYNAIAAAITEHKELTSPDILYIPTGGKHRFPVVIEALSHLDVPITTIGDFDFYREESPLKQILQLVGVDWETVKGDFTAVKKAIDGKRPELDKDQLKEAIDSIFGKIKDNAVAEGSIKAIQKELKRASPWAQAKSSGKAYLPAGNETLSFNRVQQVLAGKNIFVLDVGEIEAFDKNIGGHGPKWVNEVLKKDLLKARELEEARRFVEKCVLGI